MNPLKGIPKKNDYNVRYTVNKILADWFEKNNRIIFFICSDKCEKKADSKRQYSKGERAKQRKCAFERWFNDARKNHNGGYSYEFLTQEINDNGTVIYTGLIYPSDYPLRHEVQTSVDKLVQFVEGHKA